MIEAKLERKGGPKGQKCKRFKTVKGKRRCAEFGKK